MSTALKNQVSKKITLSKKNKKAGSAYKNEASKSNKLSQEKSYSPGRDRTYIAISQGSIWECEHVISHTMEDNSADSVKKMQKHSPIGVGA